MPPGRIALPDLLAATDRKPRDLWDLRRRGLFPFNPEHVHVAGRRGSASYYPPEAVAYLRRLAEVQQISRDADEWLWRMWLDPADWPVDIRAWALARIDRMLDQTKRAKAAGAVIKPDAEREPLGPLAGHVRNKKSRRAAVDWFVAWALGNERPGLYAATSDGTPGLSYFDLMLKMAGSAFERLQVPRFNGQLERISERGGPYLLAHFRRILALARDRDLKQARQDWRAIADLIDAAERVDWNKVPVLTAPGGKPEPPSWAARKARRTRRKPPPHVIRLTLEAWRREVDFRVILLCILLITRRLLWRSAVPKLPDLLLVIAQQWLNALPQICPEAPVEEAGSALIGTL